MRKAGGIALIALGIVLWVVAAIRLISVAMVAVSESVTAYGVGFWVGTALFVVLFALLGQKSINKGRVLLNTERTP